MEIKAQKSGVRIIFPEECENFAAEESLEALQALRPDENLVEIDLGGVKSMDTVFVNILVSLINTLKKSGRKYEIIAKSDEAVRVLGLYGLTF